jgi:hypothetical protein
MSGSGLFQGTVLPFSGGTEKNLVRTQSNLPKLNNRQPGWGARNQILLLRP